MPDGDKESNSPDKAGGIKPAILSGATWNKLLDKLLTITPKGDGETVNVSIGPGGSVISAEAGKGGASAAELPRRADSEAAPVILKGSTWNSILDYLESITPRGDGKTAAVKAGPGGSIISLLTEELFCPDFPFYFDITITGPKNKFPVTWLGQTWEESGETKAICGTGTQSASNQTWNAYGGFLIFRGSTTSQTGTFRSQQGRNHGMDMVVPTATTTLYPWFRIASYTHYTLDFGYYTFTGSGSGSSTLSFLGLVTDYTPPVGSSPYPWNGTENANRILPEMNGSVTTTEDLTISWEAVPDLPWDYDNPPT